MSRLRTYIRSLEKEYLNELFKLLRMKSISPLPGYGEELRACAKTVCAYMEDAGIKSTLYATSGNPIVYGEAPADGNAPTVLIYGHYDVQPEGDRAVWQSEPFEPVVYNGKIFARGAGDNKGQLFAHIKGYEAYKKNYGTPRVNMKYLFEGEEETGSPSLLPFAREHRDLLRADITIWSDGNIHSSGHPVLILGLKGICYIKLTVNGPCRDLHSGYAPVVGSPVWRLVWLLSLLKDRNGGIAIPGFYDGIEGPSEEGLSAIRGIPGALADYQTDWKTDDLCGAADLEAFYTKYIYEPTLNIGCIQAGDLENSKNIVPAGATAYLDVRVVPGQKPDEIIRSLRSWLDENGFEDVAMEGRGMAASFTPLDLPGVRIIKDIARDVWGKEPILYPGLGGSGPFTIFNDELGAPCVMFPYAQADQHEHGPNENLSVEGLLRGIEASAEIIARFGAGIEDE